MKKNGNWRHMFRKLNMQYLNLIQHLGIAPEQREYAQTVLGLNEDIIKLITGLDTDGRRQLADLGAPLFRLQLPDLVNAQQLYEKGRLDQASSMLTAALADGDRERGKEA